MHWYCIECSQDVKGIFRCMQDLKARMVALEVEVSRFTRTEVKSVAALDVYQEARDDDGNGEVDEIHEESANVVLEVHQETRVDEGALATMEVCRAEVREVEEDWISRWELARRKKRPAEKHTTERKEVRTKRPAGLELQNRFGSLEVEGTEAEKHVESSNSETDEWELNGGRCR